MGGVFFCFLFDLALFVLFLSGLQFVSLCAFISSTVLFRSLLMFYNGIAPASSASNPLW